MKIKDVCEKTGLTDKTIRHYIDNGLLFPDTVESYSGRRSFSFSDSDVLQLQRITILRKYMFSINDIRLMLDNENDISALIEKHISEINNELENNTKIITDLEAVDKSGIDFLSLCSQLESKAEEKKLPVEDELSPYVRLYEKMKKNKELLQIALLCAIGAIFIILVCISNSFSDGVTEFIFRVVRSENEYVFCFVVSVVLMFISFAIIGIMMIVKRKEPKKQVRLLEWTIAFAYFSFALIFSVVFVWWMAIILTFIANIHLRRSEEELYQLELKLLAKKNLNVDDIDINEHKTKIVNLVLESAAAFALGQYIVYFICPVLSNIK